MALIVASFVVLQRRDSPQPLPATASLGAQVPGTQAPRPAPPFELTTFAGHAVNLKSFAGKPLVVNFWASWCVPCRKEMPALDRTARGFAGKVGFVGIATQDIESDAKNFAGQLGISYPLAMDPNDTVGTAFNVYGLPSTFFIDSQSRIVDAVYGELDQTKLTAKLHALFPELH